MKKKRKIRYDRVIAVMLIIAAPIILMLKFHNKTGVQNSVKADVRSVTAAATTIASTEKIISVSTTTIPKIQQPECYAAAIYSVDDRQIIYNDNIDLKIAPASLTKLLTASVALKYVDKNKVFTVGSEQWLVQPYSSLCYLQIGNMLTLEDLITGMLMASGNDAAYTIAVSVARELKPEIYMTDSEAVEYFCELMNEFAESIGMTKSNFVNPDGWDDDRQFTTVSDLIKIAEYALKNSDIFNITSSFQKNVTIYSGENFTWINSNLLLSPYSDHYCESAVGMKTGTTANAGNSLIAVFNKNERNYITVVAGCKTDEGRYELSLKLLSLI